MLYTSNLQSVKKEFTDCFNLIMKKIDFIEKKEKLLPSSLLTVNEALRLKKKLVDYLIFGIDFSEAVKFLMLSDNINQDIIDGILYPTFLIHQKKELSKKIFLAKKMNLAGYTTRQISGVLNVTPATIRNYLKY